MKFRTYSPDFAQAEHFFGRPRAEFRPELLKDTKELSRSLSVPRSSGRLLNSLYFFLDTTRYLPYCPRDSLR